MCIDPVEASIFDTALTENKLLWEANSDLRNQLEAEKRAHQHDHDQAVEIQKGYALEVRMLRRQLLAHLCNCAGQETDEYSHALKCPYRLVMAAITNTLHDGLQE